MYMIDNQPKITPRERITMRERWAYRIAFMSMTIFIALGIYVLYYPSEALIVVFAIMMLVTLVLGAISGLIAAGASDQQSSE